MKKMNAGQKQQKIKELKENISKLHEELEAGKYTGEEKILKEKHLLSLKHLVNNLMYR
jgi:hypothetical protein